MGTGKSTLAVGLSSTPGWAVLSPDAVACRMAWRLVARGWDLNDMPTKILARRVLAEVPWAMYKDRLRRAATAGRSVASSRRATIWPSWE